MKTMINTLGKYFKKFVQLFKKEKMTFNQKSNFVQNEESSLKAFLAQQNLNYQFIEDLGFMPGFKYKIGGFEYTIEYDFDHDPNRPINIITRKLVRPNQNNLNTMYQHMPELDFTYALINRIYQYKLLRFINSNITDFNSTYITQLKANTVHYPV